MPAEWRLVTMNENRNFDYRIFLRNSRILIIMPYIPHLTKSILANETKTKLESICKII